MARGTKSFHKSVVTVYMLRLLVFILKFHLNHIFRNIWVSFQPRTSGKHVVWSINSIIYAHSIVLNPLNIKRGDSLSRSEYYRFLQLVECIDSEKTLSSFFVTRTDLLYL